MRHALQNIELEIGEHVSVAIAFLHAFVTIYHCSMNLFMPVVDGLLTFLTFKLAML
jgi:hypothetical protein